MGKKHDKLSNVALWKLGVAFILKLSYVISLFVLFWVSFISVNVLQGILVVFLLIFLINDSVLMDK
jgi:hypothetical protein